MRVAIIDDDPQHLELMERNLQLEGIEVQTFRSQIGVTNKIRLFQPDVVLVDLNMPHMPGEELLRLLMREVKSHYIVFSAADATRLRRVAKETGAARALSKSTPMTQIMHHIKSFEDAQEPK